MKPELFRSIGRACTVVAVLLVLATRSPCVASDAPAKRPPQPTASVTPEVDLTKELVAIASGPGFIARIVEDDAVVVSHKGEPPSPIQIEAGGRFLLGPPCSSVTKTADGRATCETRARLNLPGGAAQYYNQENKAGFSPRASLKFERKTRQRGFVTTVGTRGSSVKVSIETRDDLLTRVKLLGSTKGGNPVVLAESLRQVGDTLRWRSQIAVYDSGGRLPDVVELDGSDRNLPNGDYAIVNDIGQLGILRLQGSNVVPEWRPLADRRSQSAPSVPEDARSLRAPPPAPVQSAELTSGFDFAGFANFSARLDGDEGRASDRPITRQQVRANIDQYLNAEWTMSRANHERANLPSECSPPANKMWLRPRRLNGSVNLMVRALPYKWGGYVSVERFLREIRGDQLAGSVCTCSDPAKNYCVVEYAQGIDCSGFVSRVWGIDRYTTASLNQITDAILWKDLKLADALNKPGSHVRIFVELSEGTEIGFQIAESSVSCGGVCERVLTAREMDGYQPRRFKHILD